MKNSTFTIFCTIVLFSCKSPSYHYMTPTVNTTTYSRSGEAMGAIQFGSSGIAAKGGVALTQNINVNAWASFFPESDDGYNSREVEFSLGYQTNPRNNKATSIYAGLGAGSNEKDKIELAGNFTRPFLQIQHGAFDKAIFRGNVKVDNYFGVRMNWLLYNGTRAGNDFDDDVFYFEPYFGAAIGGENVRLELIQGFSIKGNNWTEGVRIFPYWANIGLLVKFRKR
jgi:hypothetical protein